MDCVLEAAKVREAVCWLLYGRRKYGLCIGNAKGERGVMLAFL